MRQTTRKLPANLSPLAIDGLVAVLGAMAFGIGCKWAERFFEEILAALGGGLEHTMEKPTKAAP